MHWYRTLLTFGIILLLIGCSTDPKMDTSADDDNIEITKINTNKAIKQQAYNQAKNILSKYEDIKTVKAANTDKILLIAVEIEHNKRFNLDKNEKQLTKQMNKSFPDMKVEFSTDKKIIFELDELENDLHANKISDKALKQKIKQLISLTQEKT